MSTYVHDELMQTKIAQSERIGIHVLGVFTHNTRPDQIQLKQTSCECVCEFIISIYYGYLR